MEFREKICSQISKTSLSIRQPKRTPALVVAQHSADSLCGIIDEIDRA